MVTNDLRKWTATFNIPQVALKAMVKILNENFHADIPTDPRTIMKTPRNVNFIKIGNGTDGGMYWHQGLEFCLRNCFKDVALPISISININIDGLPIYKSASKQFWPVLFNVHEYPKIHPMAIGIFFGESKPNSVEYYLRPFVEEIKPILENGFEINGHKISVRIRCFICDSPARAFIKGLFKKNFPFSNIYIYVSVLISRYNEL